MKDKTQISIKDDDPSNADPGAPQPFDSSPLVRNVTLRRPESFASGERPTVSLHLLVKNGESCLGRLLENVGPYLSEIVAVANDCTDRTIPILREYAEFRGSGFNLDIVEVTHETKPELYIMDVPETYAAGEPLVGEVLEGPFTGEPLLADWAGIRNLGFARHTKEWRLFLDADDVVQDPESIPGLCAALNEIDPENKIKVDLAASRYIYSLAEDGISRADSFRERLVRNVPYITWFGVAHEVLHGQQKTVQIDGNLIVKDLKDSTGAKIRAPGRCLKILYKNARENEWMVSPRNLIYLAMEACATMTDFASSVLDLYLTLSLWPEERAWACCMAGEIRESRNDYAAASEWYERALSEHPGSKSAYRLCRSRFYQNKWQAAVDAFRTGIENKAVLQILDNGPVYEEMSKILVASSLDKLGCVSEALTVCEEALAAFPQNSALRTMRDQLKARRSR